MFIYKYTTMSNVSLLLTAPLIAAVLYWSGLSQLQPQASVAPATTVTQVTGLKLGEKAPAFRLQNIDGNWYSLADVKDAAGRTPKGYVVVFTCNTCPFAVAYEDRLVALHNRTSAMGYPVVAIQPNDPAVKPDDGMAGMQQRAKDKNFGFLYLFDDGQKIYPQFGATRTPEIYLLDANQMLRYHGAIDDNAQDASAVKINYVESAIAALEAGNQPDPGDVKAIGCSIKTRQ